MASGDLATFCERWLTANLPRLVALRRHLHQHPELSGAEYATAALIYRVLHEAGANPRYLEPSRTGVICDVGTGPPRIAFRGDIDALPITEPVGPKYASTNPGVSHACGHDLHAIATLGTNLALLAAAEQFGELPTTYRFLYQPSEEHNTVLHPAGKAPPPNAIARSGAEHMVAGGALDPSLEYLFALHAWPGEPVGQIDIMDGVAGAGALAIRIRLAGPGGHTARPNETFDIVRASAQLAAELPAMVAERFRTELGYPPDSPQAQTRLVWGQLQAGNTINAIPTTGSLAGTLRFFADISCETLAVWVRDATLAILAKQGHVTFDPVDHEHQGATPAPDSVSVHFDLRRHATPVIHDDRANELFTAAAGAVLGPTSVVKSPPSWGGDDISDYRLSHPGLRIVMPRMRIGSTVGIHSAGFDAGDAALPLAIRVYLQLALTTKTPPPATRTLKELQSANALNVTYSVSAHEFAKQRDL